MLLRRLTEQLRAHTGGEHSLVVAAPATATRTVCASSAMRAAPSRVSAYSIASCRAASSASASMRVQAACMCSAARCRCCSLCVRRARSCACSAARAQEGVQGVQGVHRWPRGGQKAVRCSSDGGIESVSFAQHTRCRQPAHPQFQRLLRLVSLSRHSLLGRRRRRRLRLRFSRHRLARCRQRRRLRLALLQRRLRLQPPLPYVRACASQARGPGVSATARSRTCSTACSICCRRPSASLSSRSKRAPRSRRRNKVSF